MTKKYKIKTGVIGVGSMGQNHARVYNEISNLIGVSDLDEKQGKLVSERLGVKYFKNYREMLKEVEAVTIATPTSLHRQISEIVFESGVHALIEKPLAGNIEDSEAIIEASNKAGKILAVGHIERFNEAIRYSKKQLDEKKWGKVLTLSARRFSNFPARIHDVGVLFDLSIHDVDIISYLLGEKPDSIMVNGGKAKNETHEDHVILSLKYPSGIVGVCETNWLTPMKVREICITTDTHYVKINSLKQEIEKMSSSFDNLDSSNLFQAEMKLSEEKVILNKIEPLATELSDFLESIYVNKNPSVSGQAGLIAVKTVQAGLKSLSTNKVIKI